MNYSLKSAICSKPELPPRNGMCSRVCCIASGYSALVLRCLQRKHISTAMTTTNEHYLHLIVVNCCISSKLATIWYAVVYHNI